MNKFKSIMDKKGITLSPLGFGCWAIGGEFYLFGQYDGWGDIDDNESILAIRKGYELGVTFFDTADVYGTGHSETILGKAVKPFRHKVALATKFGYTYNEELKEVNGTNVTKKYIRQALLSSLKRLDTDYIDLYQLHVGDISKEELFELIDTFEELVKEGLILSYGWSSGNEELLSQFAKNSNASAIQHRYNIFEGNKNLISLAEKNNLLSIVNSPLAMGLLTGKYLPTSKIQGKDVRSSGFDWVPYFKNGKPDKTYTDKLSAIREILTSDGRTLTQGALAWLWGVSKNNLPIPGFKNCKQAEENAKAISFGPLNKLQMDTINDLINNQ